MGAADFRNIGCGATIAAAFNDLVDSARHEHGHGGYTGTIAEKSEYKLIQPTPGEEANDCIDRLFDADDKRLDKWGPALAIYLGTVADYMKKDPRLLGPLPTRRALPPTHGVWIFFGYASS
jgi:hypothetical protein